MPQHNDSIIHFFHGRGILCPSCERSIISKYQVVTRIFTCVDEIECNVHMQCMYCGDRSLITLGKNPLKIFYNFTNESPYCKSNDVVFTDLEDD